MPGDYDIEYASPWAGANSLPYANIVSAVMPTCTFSDRNPV